MAKTAWQKNQANRNKHGRTGVRRGKLKVVLSAEQLAQEFQRGWQDGWTAGYEDGTVAAQALAKALMTKRNVKDVKGLCERFLETGSIKPPKRSNG